MISVKIFFFTLICCYCCCASDENPGESDVAFVHNGFTDDVTVLDANIYKSTVSDGSELIKESTLPAITKLRDSNENLSLQQIRMFDENNSGGYVMEDVRSDNVDEDDAFVQNDEDDIKSFLNDNPLTKEQYRNQQFAYSNYRRPQQHQQYQQQQQQIQQNQGYDKDGVQYAREIIVKQGRVKGIVRAMHPQSGLRNVDQYLGVPFADAPVGIKRFMPPGAPSPWSGLKMAGKLPPVCPQNLPSLNNVNNNLSKGRYDQLKRLLPYLKTESEDCLYLNLYVPSPREGGGSSPKYPVIVYIHGESYEWNSGNPYDGSVLASYGQVIVVTLNYRLGILGFMKPGISEHTVSNFGLLDQIAALQWLKDNVGAFGGDNRVITLMGHGTGAACVNLLMVSPVAKGLFHRAILMSGSALSDWATTNHPLQATMQVAQGLNCPLTDVNEEMLICLRKKRYSEILGVRTSSPQFSTPFGPVVDGLVVPNTPHKVMGQYSDIFSRYDLMFGLTELESYHILNAVALHYGLLENEKNNLLRFYMQNRFEIRPDLALAKTLSEYAEIYTDPNRALADEHRDSLLEILSDARVAAPVVQTGIYHAKVNPRSYMYVFSHNSEAGEYAHLSQSIVGEELAYVFGAPLAQVGPFQPHYNPQERLFSEAIMKYWTNFAKTGNPKAPWKDLFLNLNPVDWVLYDIDWPEFNSEKQSYLNMGMPPVVGYCYRAKYMQFWNDDLPKELLRNTTSKTYAPYADYFTASPPVMTSRTGTSPNMDVVNGNLNFFPMIKSQERTTEDPYRRLKIFLQDPIGGPGMYNAQSTPLSTSTETIMQPPADENNTETSEITLHMLIAIVILFLAINLMILFGYIIRKATKSRKMKRKLDETTTFDGNTDDELKRSKTNDGDDSYILDIVRKTGASNAYEPVKTNHSPLNGFKMTRQLSNSTMDAHTKVVDWISQEIAKYSPKIRKNSSTSTASIKGGRPSGFGRKPLKVSVAIDATPGARSNSVLRQEPIEITKAKSLDSNGKDVIVCQEVVLNSRLIDHLPQQCAPKTEHRRRSGSPLKDYNQELKIDHKHSNSDPVQMYYTVGKYDEDITSFIENDDINVTSRDKSMEKELLTPEENLRTMQKRNYPKVLPDYPYQQNEGEYNPSASMKRRSLPPQHFMSANPSYFNANTRIPPAPPPRTSSTLGRRPSSRRLSKNLTTSPLMVAEEPPSDEEPIITSNTLHVGPLLPKHQENIYSTIKRKSQQNKDNTASSTNLDTNGKTCEEIQNKTKPEPTEFHQKYPLKSFIPTINKATNIQNKSNSPPATAPPINTDDNEKNNEIIRSIGKTEPKIIIKPTLTKHQSDKKVKNNNITRVQAPQDTEQQPPLNNPTHSHPPTTRIPCLKSASDVMRERDRSTSDSSSSETVSSGETVVKRTT